MRAAMPNYPCEFEIPDEWWVAAGMADFSPGHPAYRSTFGARLVPLREIEPPHLDIAQPRDWCGFDRARMLRILGGLKEGAEIRPVPLLELERDAVPSSKSYAYRPLDGYHRFYASIAAGFQFLPAAVIR
jgi:hypothetical protein